MADMQASSSLKRLTVLLTVGCIIFHVGVTQYPPTPQVQRGNFKPINCYFCDTQQTPDCDSRLDHMKTVDTIKARTGQCEWVVNRPFRNNIIGIPLRPYCVTFIEQIKDYGKEINYRMVRDCARPGGEPTDCMQFKKFPNMLTWPLYKSWKGWETSNRFSVLRQAVFCNSSDFCNQMTKAEFELKCNTGSLRSGDLLGAGNGSSAAVTRGTSWLYAATLGIPTILASRSGSFLHYIPLLMATAFLTPRVGLFAQADFPMWKNTPVITRNCFHCNTAQSPAECGNGAGLLGAHGHQLAFSSDYAEAGETKDVLAASLGLVNRLDPACVTYIRQEYQGGQLINRYLVRKPVLMEGFPEECMNLTDAYTKINGKRAAVVHIAKFCWTDKCNTINQDALVNECYPKLSATPNTNDALSVVQPGYAPVIVPALKSLDIGVKAPEPAPPEERAANGTGGSASVFGESPSYVLVLSVLLAAAEAAFSFKLLHLCVAF